MKLHILLLGIVSILAGCTTEDILAIDGSRHFKVFQVLNNGALATRQGVRIKNFVNEPERVS